MDEKTIIENNPDHFDSLSVFLRILKVSFPCVWECHLDGNKENATIKPKISIISAILKGKSRLIVVKNGKVIIKKILKNDTRHFIDEDIFLKLSSFFSSISVSYKNADVFQVENASAHSDIKVAQITKYQKLSQITYIKLDNSKSIFAIIIVVLFHSLSRIIQAGIWKINEKAYQTAV